VPRFELWRQHQVYMQERFHWFGRGPEPAPGEPRWRQLQEATKRWLHELPASEQERSLAGAISIAWQTRLVISAAIIVVPEPLNGS
jgi:hypothetical protein